MMFNMRSGYMGMVLCFISSFLLSLGTMMVSRMTHFHPITKSFWRFAGTFVPSIFVVVYYAFKKESIISSFWPLRMESVKVIVSLAFRSFFGCTAATLQYYSLKYLPLGDSSVICNSYPVFVNLLATLFLGEDFGGFFTFISTLITLGGVAIVSRPAAIFGGEVDVHLMTGVGLALGCAVLMACAIVMIRHLHQIHHCITLVGFGGFGTVEAAILAWGFDVFEFPTEDIDILKAVAIGLLSCGSQMFLIFALKCDNAGPVALVKTTDVLYAFIWQMIFIQEIPDYIRHRAVQAVLMYFVCLVIFSIIGAVVMMSGIFLCGFKKYIASLDDKDSVKEFFWFVLK